MLRSSVGLVILLVAVSFVTARKSKEQWLPFRYAVGHWTVRPSNATALSLFTRAPVECNILKADAYEGVLVGGWLLRGANDTEPNNTALEEAAESAMPSNTPPERPVPKYEERLNTGSAGDLVVPFRLEGDGSVLGGTLVIGEAHDDAAEDTDDEASNSNVLRHRFNFVQSPGNFHHFKVLDGQCPTVGDVNPNTPLGQLQALLTEGGVDGWCTTYHVAVLDEDSVIVTLSFKNSVSKVFVAHRQDASAESGINWWSIGGTVGMLLIVVAVKFGPRLYFKSQGIDTDLYMNKKKLNDKIAGLTPAQRGILMAKRREMMAALSEENIIKAQEEEQRELQRTAPK
jgi:hypothetical protein